MRLGLSTVTLSHPRTLLGMDRSERPNFLKTTMLYCVLFHQWTFAKSRRAFPQFFAMETTSIFPFVSWPSSVVKCHKRNVKPFNDPGSTIQTSGTLPHNNHCPLRSSDIFWNTPLIITIWHLPSSFSTFRQPSYTSFLDSSVHFTLL